MLKKANAPICSWATIVALYGTDIRLTTKVIMENWNTQLAAYKRSEGIVIWVLINQTPIVSDRINTIKAMNNWIITDVENTSLILASVPLPN